MAERYIFVRIRRADFDKIIKEKKEPMERDLSNLMGKPIKIKNTQLFNIAANCTWDFNSPFASKMFKLMRIKKG